MSSSDLEPRQRTADQLIDAWQDAWSGKDPSAFTGVCSVDVHYEDPLTDQPLEGADAIGAHATRLWAGFPDARVETLGPRVIDGSLVAAPAKLLGTHREPLEGLPATNRFLVVPAIFYLQLTTSENPRIARVRAFFDLYDAGVQLGVLPGRGTFGGKALLMLRGFGLRTGR